jgi:inosine-uridine nucleoside N-ribohydrolase
MHKHRLIIDCDPGHDDFAAIALATVSPLIEIEAITTVCGNASLANTTRNALSIVHALGLDVPVYAGAPGALLHRRDWFPVEFHGVTGMDSAGASLPPSPRLIAEGHAAVEIVRRVSAAPGEVTLVALGPMTNLALALTLDPAISTRIRQLVFMGGGLRQGNVTAQAEFNFWADPEAAAIVLRAGIPTVMFGLDVTDRACITAQDITCIRHVDASYNPVADIFQFLSDRSGDVKAGRIPGPPLHDTCPMAWLINPELFEVEHFPVDVITSPGPLYGSTIADRRPWAAQETFRIGVALELDRETLAKQVTDALVTCASKVSELQRRQKTK